jgi:hypothetical protein
MNKKINIIILIYFIVFLGHPFSAAAQQFEIGMFVGGSNYIGDLEYPERFLSQTGIAYGGLVRYNIDPNWTVSGGFKIGLLQGSDANTRNEIRGFSFTNDFSEVSVLLEWNFLGSPAVSRNGTFSARVEPYLFIGGAIAFCTVKPKMPPFTFLDSERKEKVFALPAGGGLKFRLSEEFTCGLELGNRFTNSDFLDGFSHNVNPKTKDWYLFGGVTLSYTIGNDPYIYNKYNKYNK